MSLAEVIAGAVGGLVAAVVVIAVMTALAFRGRRVFSAIDEQQRRDDALQRRKTPPA